MGQKGILFLRASRFRAGGGCISAKGASSSISRTQGASSRTPHTKRTKGSSNRQEERPAFPVGALHVYVAGRMSYEPISRRGARSRIRLHLPARTSDGAHVL